MRKQNITPPTLIEIKWEDFKKQFKPQQNYLRKESCFGGSWFDNFNFFEALYIKLFAKIHPERVWTHVDDEGKHYFVSGYEPSFSHGYVITASAVPPNTSITAVYGVDYETPPLTSAKKTQDWQVTTILPNNLFIETDCNSGAQRYIRKSVCSCGQVVLIEYCTEGFRKDGKRIFYPDVNDSGVHVFRCKQCHQPVNETVQPKQKKA